MVAFPTTIVTARVKLSCGVEQLFHVFAAKAPFALHRKMKLLERQVRAHPSNWKKRLELADLFYFAGEWNKAVAEWRQTLEIHSHLPAVLKLGGVLLKLGGIETATEVFNGARRKNVQSPAARHHLDGWIALSLQDAARAALEFRAAAEREPENVTHWHCLAVAHERAGGLPEALAAIQHALNLNPDDLVALSLGHEMLLAAGEVELAGQRGLHLLKLAPRDLLTLRRLVDCRCQMKLTEGAAGRETVRLLRRARRLAPNSFLIHETLTSFFLAQGKRQKALAVIREFADAHPSCADCRKNYLQLKRTGGQVGCLPTAPDDWMILMAKQRHEACQKISAGNVKPRMDTDEHG